ncbi:MAG: hypothetical protein ABI574_13120 [Burkholderiales bacterium]
MTLLEYLTSKLPSAAAKAVAIGTLPSALAVSSLPHFLSPLFPSSTESEVVLVQISTFLSVLLLGLLACLYLSFRGASKNVAPVNYARLAEHHRVIVAISRITRPTVEKIALEVGLAEEAVRYHVQLMRDHNYIEPTEPISLTKEGHRAVVQL